ncbi:hypothetical protein K439DRAFT_1286742, partial [Ramaria rubella]
WSFYIEESTERDKAMLEGWNDSLDVLLILAGLFSAVLTAFLVQSYPMLQPDPQDTTVALLARVVERLDSFSNNTLKSGVSSVGSAGASPLSPTFEVSGCAWWINLVWFSSLMCSLSAAFIAMLAKQWLHAYTM